MTNSVEFGDFNGDGYLDLLFCGPGHDFKGRGHLVSLSANGGHYPNEVYLNNKKGGFVAAPLSPGARVNKVNTGFNNVVGIPRSVAVADVDGDGKADVWVGSNQPPHKDHPKRGLNRLLLGIGDGKFSLSPGGS